MNAWLVRTSGRLAGSRYPVAEGVTRVGRGPQNDVLIEDDSGVSQRHFEIHREGDVFRLEDLGSTNGTYVNGVRTAKAKLEPPCFIQLGTKGPMMSLILGDVAPPSHDRTVLMGAPADQLGTGRHDDLAAEALAKIRLRRFGGKHEDTITIMRQAIRKAVARSGRKLRIAVAVLAVALVGLGGFTIWKVSQLRSEKKNLDGQIREVESLLAKAAEDPKQTDELMARLEKIQGAAREVTSSFLYRLSAREKEGPVEQELKTLFAEFGAETYNIPPDLLAAVEHFVTVFQGPERMRITEALGRSRKDLDAMRAIFRADSLPEDLAYITVVESAVSGSVNPQSGAAGPWQLMPPTARQLGLRVEGNVDERLDVRLSTKAASKLIRELILDFGSGGSVMLAVAAYNSGAGRVRRAVRTVKDPIRQRNFWYLYRTKALPNETREYVPKVLAVLIIARNPAKFGFGA